MIVVDANLLVYLWAGGHGADLADEVFRRDAAWIAPTLWRSEFRNAMSHAVLALAMRSGCSAYDCEYVTLAEDLDLPLVTFDGAVTRAFPDRAVAPETFLRD